MKVTKLPLPRPWSADTAVLHLYRVWSSRGRIKLHQITLHNPNMVNALVALWQRDHRQEHAGRDDEVASGTLPQDLGQWRLLRKLDGSGVIVIGREETSASERRQPLLDPGPRYVQN
jgi:hypothetical protein